MHAEYDCYYSIKKVIAIIVVTKTFITGKSPFLR